MAETAIIEPLFLTTEQRQLWRIYLQQLVDKIWTDNHHPESDSAMMLAGQRVDGNTALAGPGQKCWT